MHMAQMKNIYNILTENIKIMEYIVIQAMSLDETTQYSIDFKSLNINLQI